MIVSLMDFAPQVSAEEMVSSLVPPAQFIAASFDNYRPDPGYASQSVAVDAVRAFVADLPADRTKVFGKLRKLRRGSGLYLDGGFGVGKTHLLAAAWNACAGAKVFGTFIEFTAIVGAMGYAEAVARLHGTKLICIDEFELDDPGDTLIMSRLLGELSSAGTSIIATSNTPPNALGEGRFAADGFAREIQSLADIFTTVRIDGTDYRQRHTKTFHEPSDAAAFELAIAEWSRNGLRVAVDDFDDVLAHLSALHPVRYQKVVEMVDAVAWRGVHQVASHNDGLRLVAFVDRLYDANRRVVVSGSSLSEVFSPEMRESGYAKKYLRALSRLAALAMPPELGIH